MDISVVLSILGIGLAVAFTVIQVRRSREDKKAVLQKIEESGEASRQRDRRLLEMLKDVSTERTTINRIVVPDGYDEAEAEVREEVSKGTELDWKLLLKFGNVEYMQGRLDNALLYYQALRDQGKRAVASALGNMGVIHQDRYEFELSLKRHEEALKVQLEIEDRKGEANQLGNIGVVHFLKGDYVVALKYLEESLRIHTEIAFYQGEATTLGNIGNIYGAMDKPDQALRYFEKGLVISKKFGYRHSESSCLCSIGSVYRNQGSPDQALEYYQKALKIDKELKHRQGESMTLGNIGLAYKDKRDLGQALKYLKEALGIMEQHGFAHGRDTIERAIAEIKAEQDTTK